MNEQNQWPFSEMADGEEFDLDAVFGGSSSTDDTNPFAAAVEQPEPSKQPEPESEGADAASMRHDDNPAHLKSASAQPILAPASDTHVPDAQPEPAAEPQSTPEPSEPDEPVNPIEAAFAQKETEAAEKTAKSLFEKVPIFSYGGAKEEITDPAMTFEALRRSKEDDFPELAEPKRVTWSVEYGKTTKQITAPSEAVILSTKMEIERSKEFLDNLKKSKDKSPDCLVKPRVTAKSKGIAAYKGVFLSLEEARVSDKVICLIPGSDGQVHELRKTELGEFIAPKDNVVEFPAVRAGFTPALPRVPLAMLMQIVAFFRSYMSETGDFEALAHILWDKEQQKFLVHIPPQKVSRARVDADLSQVRYPEDRYLHYIDIHSHNSMAAKFSATDDDDEQATRIYIVVGRLERLFPSIAVRMSCGGTFLPLEPGVILEGFDADFPQVWRDNVETLSLGDAL